MVLLGAGAMESSLWLSSRAPAALKELAAVRSAQMVGCSYCVDIGSSLLPALGLDDAKLRAVSTWRESDAFDETERLVLELAECVTSTPVEVPPGLLEKLEARMSRAATTELVAYVCWENWRGRFNHTFGIGSAGFCELRPANS
jgi:AhpD family alkylhydroperoxidase